MSFTITTQENGSANITRLGTFETRHAAIDKILGWYPGETPYMATRAEEMIAVGGDMDEFEAIYGVDATENANGKWLFYVGNPNGACSYSGWYANEAAAMAALEAAAIEYVESRDAETVRIVADHLEDPKLRKGDLI